MSRVMVRSFLVFFCVSIVALPAVWADWVRDGVPVCAAAGYQTSHRIISDDAGGAIVVWTDNRAGDEEIYAQRLNAFGGVEWAIDGIALCTAAENQDYPAIATDGAGGAIVAWEDPRNRNPLVYAQRVNARGEVQWTADGIALRPSGRLQELPQIASDGAGGAIVVWQESDNSGHGLFAQRVNASGVVQWTPHGVALRAGAMSLGNHGIISDGEGGAIVAWEDFSNYRMRIYSQRVSAAGALQWTVDGVCLAPAGGDQYLPRIAPDGEGGAIVAWEEYRNGNNDIRAQRVNAEGIIRWTTAGAAICMSAESQYDPFVVSDGSGGAIVAWRDYRSGNGDIFAQRVDAPGTTQWTIDGIAICVAPGDQFIPVMVSDGESGAMIAWYDFRGEAGDIYAQRVDSSGSVMWPVDGVPLCAAEGSQEVPRIASPGAGDAIVAWRDGRSSISGDIYALRLSTSGSLPPETATRSALRQNYPNPFNARTRIAYTTAEPGPVALEIYAVTGKLIVCLVDERQDEGSHTADWDGTDEEGESVASGIYLCRLTAGTQAFSRKLVLLR